MTDVVRAGIVFVSSAGNNFSALPGTLTKGADGAILVGNSLDLNTIGRGDDDLACSSSRGPRRSDGDLDTLDELRPDLAAPGTAILAPLAQSRDQYVGLTGTSMSAPHVAGTAALMLQANATLRPLNLSREAMGDVGAVPVRDLLQVTAQDKADPLLCPPQFAQPGKFGKAWDNAWGYGLLDSYAAVRAAQGP
jgi:serine protease AprX